MKEPLELWGPQLYLVVSRALDLKLRDVILVRPTINCMIWNKLCNLAGSPFPRIKWDFNFIVTFFDSFSHFGYLLIPNYVGVLMLSVIESQCWFSEICVKTQYLCLIYEKHSFCVLIRHIFFLPGETLSVFGNGWYVELLWKPGLRSKKNIWVFILKRI